VLIGAKYNYLILYMAAETPEIVIFFDKEWGYQRQPHNIIS